ncbi:MAG: gfo/Idh/MocA family oxidoreductase, partial [Chloroflexi bacterium]|nr:gfo/Idh/MocA family oxidoreductase [Chloroflexota bacterium]
SQAQISAAHGYHGVSLIRRFLGVEFENATVTAHRFVSDLAASPGRDGPPTQAAITRSTQTIATLDFGDRLGVFDFTGDQYFSWIRSPRVLVRGDRGEINNGTVRYLDESGTPITVETMRQDAGQQGNLEGYYHKGYLAGSEWVYRNPYGPGRLSDDEIANASCLEKTAAYAAGGSSFYSVAEAAQDHYLGMTIDRAAESGERIKTETQSWATPPAA